MIGIIDYGLGNLRSVQGAVEKLGFEALVSGSAEDLRRADKLILPGVGAFGDGMKNLRDRGLIEPLSELVEGEGKPILGICLGSQLMTMSSEEFGRHEGLGWIDAEVRRLDPDNGLRVPHVGWNEVDWRRDSVLRMDLGGDALFYFVHSYFIDCADDALVLATCDYGGRFVAAFERANVYGTQFHPEKSQRAGLDLLGNFLREG